MKYNRKQRSSNPIDILKFETVETGAVFKQYDVNTSILEIALVANGEPVRIDNSFKIYATVKPRQRSAYDVLYRYSEDYEENETSNYKILLNAEKMKARSLNNMINLYLSPLALSFSGDMVAELILVDLENQQRVTSQEFTFKIEPSLTPNQEEDISYTVIEDLGGTYITDSEELKLLAIDGVSGFKLSFTGLEVNEILQSVQGLNYEENNEALESLNQKDEEIQESIKAATKEREKINSEIILLKNKDSELDTEIEQLNLYNSTNDLNINEIKSDLSKLKEYNSSNDIKIQTIDREIESLKEYDSSNSTKIQSIENEIRSLKKYDETNTSSINEIKEDVVNLKSYNSSNDESIKNINSNIESLKQYNSNNTEVVNGIKSDLQSYKSSNNQAVSDVRENLESYKTSNNQSVNSINENLENFRNVTNQTVNDINVDISSLKDYNTTNDSKIEEINRNIERNTNSISENLQKINSNTSLIEVNKEAISSINLKNEEIERDLTSSKENIENNKNDILNLNKKVNKNTEDIKLLKEGSIGGSNSNSNKEVIDARTATTGEVFDTLDERIDHEVDRLNKKIDVTMLQQEDKESHTIENSVEGLTTDMVIKGRTLANISPTGVANCNNVNDFNHNYQEVQVIQGDGFIQCTQPSTGKYNILGYDSSMLKPLTNYIHIADVEIVSNESNEDCKFHFGYMDKKKEVFINSGRGIISIVSKTKESVIGGNKSWIGIMLGADSSISKNRSFKVYNIASYEITEEEASKEINELLEKYPIKCEGIKSFGQEEDKISILSHGYNLLDFKKINKNVPWDSNGSQNNIVLDDGLRIFRCSSNHYPQQTLVYLKKGTYFITKTITPSRKDLNNKVLMYFYKKNDKFSMLAGDTNIIISESGYYHVGLEAEGSINDNDYFDVRNIGLFSKNIPYEPYKEDKKDILLQDLGFDEGLRGLNDTIYDELNKIRNVAIKRVDKRTFTGNESWQPSSELQNEFICFYINFPSTTATTPILCNNFIQKPTMEKDVECITNNGGGNSTIRIKIKKSKLATQDVEGFKKWLKENPTTIYYELAEPVETPLSENINLKTFREKTYVSFEIAISGTSSFKAPVDTKATIARLNRENRALEEENKTLRQDFESTTLSLTDSDLELVKQNVDMDFRLMEVEFALDIPQSTLSSNINFKNKKGEVKSMARTPYEMMRIVILSGDYDREDYIHKVGKYYERGRMTKEEHDELMSLMTADEVISKKN